MKKFLLGLALETCITTSVMALPPLQVPIVDLSGYAKLAALAPIAPTYGTSLGGETTLTSPAIVPTSTPYWIRLTINGVVQRPGYDFTTNGTTAVTLSSALLPNTDWMIEQLQRNPS